MNESDQVHVEQQRTPLGGLRDDPTYLSMLRAYGSRFAEVIVAGVVVNVLGLALPLYSRLVYDKVIGNHIPETLWALTLGIALFTALELLLRVIRIFYTEQLAGRFDTEFDEMSIKRLLTNKVVAPVGEVITRYRDLAAARDLMSSNYMLLLVDLPFLLLYVVVLFLIGGHMVWVLLVGCVLLVGAQLLLKVPGNDYANLSMKVGGTKGNKLASIVYGMETLKTSLLRGRVVGAFLEDAHLATIAQAKSRFWVNTGYAISTVGYTIISVATLVVGVYLVEDNLLTVGALIASSLIISRATSVISSLVVFLSRIEMFRRARAEFDAVFAQQAEVEQMDVLREQMRGLIQVSHLTLNLDRDERPVLSQVSLTIQPGEKVGIVGRSGSGKSSLLRALAGVHAPDAGRVLIDGVAVQAYTPDMRARCIGYKPQDPFLFDGTIGSNIFAGDRIPGNVYEAALTVSGLDELIARGDLRIDQAVKAPGSLSGGQRQMVALARAVAVTPPIMLLDEPTTGVDQAAEARIIENLMRFSAGRTLVVATHSAGLLQRMDRIIVIDGGKIVADGPRIAAQK